MTYQTDVATKQYQQNLIIKIGSDYFGSYQPDSGLTIDSDKVGVIESVQLAPTTIDVRYVNMSVASIVFTLVDLSGNITAFLTDEDNRHIGDTVELWVGRITGSSAFSSDYQLVSTTTIRSISKVTNGYRFEASEVTDRMRKPVFDDTTYLTAAYTAGGNTLTVADNSDFAASGTLKLGGTFLAYSGKNGTTEFTGVSIGTGSYASDDEDKDIGQVVEEVTQITGNPIDLILQLLISGSGATGAGAAYDVLSDGLAIDEDLVNITAFENIKNEYFSTDNYELNLYGLNDALKFIEEELLLPTGTRIFPADGLISMAILDKAPTSLSPQSLDEDTVLGTPTYRIRSDILFNQIRIFYDYHEGTGEYRVNTLFTNAESITDFGARPELVWRFKGILTANSGAAIVSALANRMLARLSTPRTEMIVRAHMDSSLAVPGNIVRVEHSELPPTDTTTLGLDALAEVMSKAINFNTGDVTYGIHFTSFSSLRVGLIAPAPLIASVTSQTVFDVPDGSCFLAGFYLRLWNDSTNAYYPDAAIEIDTVVGDTITMKSAFTTTLTTSVRVKIADYDAGSENVKVSYAFISPNTGTFVSDSKKAYQILF